MDMDMRGVDTLLLAGRPVGDANKAEGDVMVRGEGEVSLLAELGVDGRLAAELPGVMVIG